MFTHWYKRPGNTQLLQALDQWFLSERGSQLQASQQLAIDEYLTDCFGYHLVQLSVNSSAVLHGECRVQQKYRGHPSARQADTLCEFDQLPFANESVDVVILHHTQEYVANPHQLLREVQRVVVPHGRVIIVGFNPWSALGLSLIHI